MTISAFLILVGLICTAGPEQQLNTQEIQLDPGKSVSYTIDAVDSADKRVTLSFLLRGKGDYDGGFTYGMQVRINGRVLPPAEDRRMVRLVNKPLTFTYKIDGTFEKSYAWRRFYRPTQGWVIIYSPDYETSDQRPWLAGQWSKYVLAVEDLLHTDKPNTIEFRNEHPRRRAVIMLDKIAVTRTDQKGFGQTKPVPAFPNRPPRRTPFNSLKNPDVQVDSTGAILIQHDGKKYALETIFSYPKGGYNILGTGPAPEKGEENFVASVTPIDIQTWRVTAGGKYYKIDRLVKVGWGKVSVVDTITNKTDSMLGVITSHYLKVDRLDISNVLIGGNPDPALNNIDMDSNPTLFIPLANGGLGLVVNDGMSRLQARFFYDAAKQTAGLRTENLTIGAGKSYTISRTIYVLEDQGYGDYFDFINYVRRDWGSNFLINGPYVFINPDRVLRVDDATLAESAKVNDTYCVIITSSAKDPKTGEHLSWFRQTRWGQPNASSIIPTRLLPSFAGRFRRSK